MRVLSRATLCAFGETHADADSVLEIWYGEATKANWKSPADIKAIYANASILANDRVCFNIKGNQYRLIVGINYAYGSVCIKWIGTHAEYDKIDANTIGSW